MKIRRIIVVPCALAAASAVGLFAAPALAFNSYLTAFNSRYPGSTLSARMSAATGSSCNVCHHPTDTSNSGNCYKNSLISRLDAGRTIAQALGDVEVMDSDNDGVNNVTEILASRTDLAGQVGYAPGLIGATGTDPCGAAGAVSNQLETPPPSGPTCDGIDFNNDGLFPDTQDIADFLTVFAGGVCAGQQPGDVACNSDIDYNNDGLFPDTQDISAFLSVFAGGACI